VATPAEQAHPEESSPAWLGIALPMRRTRSPSLIFIVYVVVGVAVAASHDYFRNVNTVREVFAAVLAIALWPLVLLGVDLHLKK
jgi:hypothetical protein